MNVFDYQNKKIVLLNNISNGEIKHQDDCIRSSICSKCKGFCCKNTPCAFSPYEFIDITNIDYMKSILNTGLLSIADLSLFEDILYIRPRGLKDLDTIYTGFITTSNECIFLSNKGCLLNEIYRPSEGLLLVPHENRFGEGVCDSNYDINKLVKDWKKYQKVLLELLKIYKNKEIDKPKVDSETIKKYEGKILKLKSKDCIVK